MVSKLVMGKWKFSCLTWFSFCAPGSPAEAGEETSLFRHAYKIILFVLIAYLVLKC